MERGGRGRRGGVPQYRLVPLCPMTQARHEHPTVSVHLNFGDRIIPTFKRIYTIRDGRTHEEVGEGRAVDGGKVPAA
uniref:Uncharacterized protein n=1 Tax=uncultured microorganism TaxID=358574 RepID=F8UH27_9ZZZZ|nr:conserved hypothetical protein [uncultured microorganism]